MRSVRNLLGVYVQKQESCYVCIPQKTIYIPVVQRYIPVALNNCALLMDVLYIEHGFPHNRIFIPDTSEHGFRFITSEHGFR
jgi:hypothetical protein